MRALLIAVVFVVVSCAGKSVSEHSNSASENYVATVQKYTAKANQYSGRCCGQQRVSAIPFGGRSRRRNGSDF